MTTRALLLILLMGFSATLHALEKPEITYRVFQFPADQMPRIDGKTDDWAIVPAEYAIGADHLTGHGRDSKKRSFDVTVRVGWVKGLNRLYFLYEAEDDYWDFSRPGLQNDTFEIVVDGDVSGGPLVDKGHKDLWTPARVGEPAATPDDRISTDAAHWATHGVHAQNYHIFTPAVGKDWAMAWGSPTWIKDFPWANSAQSFQFKPGEPGKFVLEFWITLFDYAGAEGPQRAVQTMLRENNILGLGWVVIDYDDVNKRESSGFWTLSPQRTMFGHASQLCAFRLMPVEPALRPKIDARWDWTVVDHDRRLVAFFDRSAGIISSWKWDFGDGATATEQHPQHTYAKPGNYVVVLEVSGPDGTSRRSKVWDVQLR